MLVGVISSLLRRPSRLIGNQFREAPEYPDFAWREALLNAIAHRDYGVEGAGTEVWLFEDRMEVVSPGALAGNLTTDELLTLRRVHRSRNPRIVRVLVDLGFARDQGEGIPRMFAEMKDAFLAPPSIEATNRSVTVALRNALTLNAGDREFISQLGALQLSRDEFRALLHAYRQGQIDNASLRTLSGLDTLGASTLLRDLRNRHLLALHSHGANSYYTLSADLTTDTGEFVADTGEFGADTGEFGADTGEFGADTEEELPLAIRAAIDQLGQRPRRERLRPLIHAICAQGRWVTSAELAEFLNFRPHNLTAGHLAPMVESGQLERRFPGQPNHPRQAYRAVAQSPV